MKKLSKILESTWGDMARRAEGEQVRKEDDVQFMDATAFCKYCEKRYTITGYGKGVDYTKEDDEWERVEIPGIYTKGAFLFFYLVFHSNGEKTIPIAERDLNKMPEIKNRLEQEFTLKSNYNHWVYQVFPKDGSEVTNQFFIDFVDFCLDNFNSPDIKKFASRTKGVNESTWGDMVKRAEGEEIRREDIPEQDPVWWRNIALKDPEKYPQTYLKSLDLIYDFAIYPLMKTLGLERDEFDFATIVFHFKYETNWDLTIVHNKSYGNDTYSMYAHGDSSPWQINYSKLNITEKRSIRDRLENRKFYVYETIYGGGTQIDYHLREESTYKGDKGIELKK